MTIIEAKQEITEIMQYCGPCDLRWVSTGYRLSAHCVNCHRIIGRDYTA
jgi:hypothetical protein